MLSRPQENHSFNKWGVPTKTALGAVHKKVTTSDLLELLFCWERQSINKTY